ncbi:retrovirus-related pol polyprotein from transposon TNT 1-94 [Tanacetum coccineum]
MSKGTMYRTLVRLLRAMLRRSLKFPLFFWAEAIATSCFTRNRSLVIPRHEKTPYHIINGWKPSVKFFYIFGSLCYIVRDGENLYKMKEKGDECIFVGFTTVMDPCSNVRRRNSEHNNFSSEKPKSENVHQAAETLGTDGELYTVLTYRESNETDEKSKNPWLILHGLKRCKKNFTNKGYGQQEVIDFEESFALVAVLEARSGYSVPYVYTQSFPVYRHGRQDRISFWDL